MNIKRESTITHRIGKIDPQVEAGIYILTVQQDGYTQSKKVFIQNKK